MAAFKTIVGLIGIVLIVSNLRATTFLKKKKELDRNMFKIIVYRNVKFMISKTVRRL